MWNKLKAFLAFMRDFEPALLRSGWISLVAMLGSAGVVISPGIDDKVLAWIGVAVAVISTAQALWTRFGVYAPAVIKELEAAGIHVPTSAEVKANSDSTGGTPGGGPQDDGTPPEPDAPELDFG